jgi:hypothetical protein
MNLMQAFVLVEQLPARERLMVGRPDEMRTRWSSGNINDVDLVQDLGSSVVEAVEEFRAGNGNLRVLILRNGEAIEHIVGMGIDSIDAIADALAIAAQDRARRAAR